MRRFSKALYVLILSYSFLRELRSMEKPLIIFADRRLAPPRKTKWIPHPQMISKINVDGAVAELENKGSTFALAEDLMLSKIYVASDCKQVVKNIHKGSMGRHGVVIFKNKTQDYSFPGVKFCL
jgi:hypothetical protein